MKPIKKTKAEWESITKAVIESFKAEADKLSKELETLELRHEISNNFQRIAEKLFHCNEVLEAPEKYISCFYTKEA